MTASATDVVRAVAGYGLPGAAPPLPQAALDDETWEAVLAAVSGHRVTGHMVRMRSTMARSRQRTTSKPRQSRLTSVRSPSSSCSSVYC